MMARAGEEIGVNLAVSLHAVTKEVRDEIVPINRKYGIEELLQACADYPGANNARRITFEYVMLKDKNDSDADARELVRLLQALRAAGQGQSDPVQPLARRAVRMLDARADPRVLEHRLRSRHLRAGAHPARARHRRGVRAAEDRGGEEESRAELDRQAEEKLPRLADLRRRDARWRRARALLGGAMNALAGGGTFATMPALIALGLPVDRSPTRPATSRCCPARRRAPGRFATSSSRSAGCRHADCWRGSPSSAGWPAACCWSSTPARAFDLIIPWLLLFASLAMAFGKHASRLAARARRRSGARTLVAAQALLGIYGGYFGGGVGLMMTAT